MKHDAVGWRTEQPKARPSVRKAQGRRARICRFLPDIALLAAMVALALGLRVVAFFH